MGNKSFKKYYELREGFFSNLFGKKQETEPGLDRDMHVKTPVVKKVLDKPDYEDALTKYGYGNFWQALRQYKSPDGRTFPDKVINSLRDNDKYNKEWNVSFRNQYVLSKNQPEKQIAVTHNALEYMGIPDFLLEKPKTILPSLPLPPTYKVPDTHEVEEYVKRRIGQEGSASVEQIRNEVMKKWPGLLVKYGKDSVGKREITKKINRVIKSSMNVVHPDSYEDEENKDVLNYDKNILSFDDARRRRGMM